MTTSPGYKWNLRTVMAGQGLWKTSDLGPLLAARGVVLSNAQIYRLVANTPERLSLKTLAALCDSFSCTPNDLIEITAPQEQSKSRAPVRKARPRRARVGPS
jgi:DNA-binding Xre family transcriptional regulator